MDTQKRGWIYYLRKIFSSKRSLSIIATVILIVAIPFTVFLAQQIQEIRQRAQEKTTASQNESSITYPWNYRPTTRRLLPVAVNKQTKVLLSSIPFSSASCQKRPQGDADCNNIIDLSDLSYWQIDYEKGTTQFANFNGDKTVDLADYAIWRKYAIIPTTPVIQKVAQKLWLDKLFAFFSESFSFNGFYAYAQQGPAGATVASSTVTVINDLYSIVNSYTDRSFAVQTMSPDSQGGALSYYDANGNALVQVSNFLRDTATSVVQVGTNTVSVTNTPNGPTLQTVQDANGSFVSSQVWPSFDAYTRNDTPQAATLPVDTGFATMTVAPNKGAIVVQRDSMGKTIFVATINPPTITINNYKANSYVYSNSQNNETYLRIANNRGGTTTYSFDNLTVIKTTVTNEKGETNVITSGTNGQYHIVTTTNSGEKTEQDVTDPMQAVGVNSPAPSTITESTQAYSRLPNNNRQYSFLSLFSTSNAIPPQLFVVDQILAAQNRPAVLGAKTVNGKVLLAQEGAGDQGEAGVNSDTYNSSSNATDDTEGAQPASSSTGEGVSNVQSSVNDDGTQSISWTNSDGTTTSITNDASGQAISVTNDAPDRPGNYEVDTSVIGDVAGEGGRATANEDGTWSASGIDANGVAWSDSGYGATDPAGQALSAFYSHNQQAGIPNETVSTVADIADVGASVSVSTGVSSAGSTGTSTSVPSVPSVPTDTDTSGGGRAPGQPAEPEPGQGAGSYPGGVPAGPRAGGQGEPEPGQGAGSYPGGVPAGPRAGGQGEPEPDQGRGTYPGDSGSGRPGSGGVTNF